jgi:hypothetical protein
MHHRGVLFGREAFGRVGVDFAWNVHVVKIGNSGAGGAPSPNFAGRADRTVLRRLWGYGPRCARLGDSVLVTE